MPAQGWLRLPCRYAPEVDVAVFAAGRQRLAVRVERQHDEQHGIAGERVNFLTVGNVPEANRAVLARGSQQSAVWAEGHRPRVAGMTGQPARRQHEIPGRTADQVPEADAALPGLTFIPLTPLVSQGAQRSWLSAGGR